MPIRSVVQTGSGDGDIEVFNVKDYGAVGNGSVDDINAIDDAIDAAITANGGIVYFPPGTYMVSSTVVVDDALGVILMGAGGGASANYYTGITTDGVSEIKATSGFSTSSALIYFQSKSDGVGIRDMMLNGNSRAEFLIDAQNVYNSSFENINGVLWNGTSGSYAVRIRNDGGSGKGTNNQYWANCHFVKPDGSYASGLDINPNPTVNEYTCCEIRFVGCVFTASNAAYGESGPHGVRLGNCDHISFIGCHIQPHIPAGSTGPSASNWCSFLVQPRLANGFPSNITVTNSPAYGGIAYENTYANWSNNNPAIVFEPYFTQDSQYLPPTTISGSDSLPSNLVGGHTDIGWGIMNSPRSYHAFDTPLEQASGYKSGYFHNGGSLYGRNEFDIKLAYPEHDGDWRYLAYYAKAIKLNIVMHDTASVGTDGIYINFHGDPSAGVPQTIHMPAYMPNDKSFTFEITVPLYSDGSSSKIYYGLVAGGTLTVAARALGFYI